jgi:hypothetical protein
MLVSYGAIYMLVALMLFLRLRSKERLRTAAYTNKDNLEKPCFSIVHLMNLASGSRFQLPFAAVPFLTGAAILMTSIGALLVLFYVGVGASIAAAVGIIVVLPGLNSFEALLYFRAASKAVNSLGHRDLPYLEYFTRWLWAGLGYYAFLGMGMFVLSWILPIVSLGFFAALILYIRLIFWSGLTVFSFSRGVGLVLSLFTVAGVIVAGWIVVKFMLGIAGEFLKRVLKLKLELPEEFSIPRLYHLRRKEGRFGRK